jgi:glyoxylase-like metal-dependent hydrolase (beta-lactamase superfamily II)
VEVAEGVHRLTQGVVNFYLVEAGGKLTLVDAGAPGDWDAFARAVGSLGRTLDDLDAVVLTHAHSDHTGYASRARRRSPARVAPLTGRTGPQIAPDGLNRDSERALRSLDVLAPLPADLVLAGHGEPWTDGIAEAVRLAKPAGRS